MNCGNEFIDPEVIRLRVALREIERTAVLSAHAQKYLRNMETIDRIRDIAREALAVDEVSP